jgi:hypothetical protein
MREITAAKLKQLFLDAFEHSLRSGSVDYIAACEEAFRDVRRMEQDYNSLVAAGPLVEALANGVKQRDVLRGKLQSLHATHLALGGGLKAAGLLPDQVGRHFFHLPLIPRLRRTRQGQGDLLADLERHTAAILRHGQLLTAQTRGCRLPGGLLDLLTTTQAPHQHQGAEP